MVQVYLQLQKRSPYALLIIPFEHFLWNLHNLSLNVHSLHCRQFSYVFSNALEKDVGQVIKTTYNILNCRMTYAVVK